MKLTKWVFIGLGLGLLIGCGDSGPANNRGTLNSQQLVANTEAMETLKSSISSSTAGQNLALGLQYINTTPATFPSTVNLSAAMPCQFRVYKINYNTAGAAGEATTATAAVMIPFPTPGASACQGPDYPVVLAAHGTDYNKAADVSNVATSSEGALFASIFAAQGFVVIAPNYAGYDTSNLSYHPYLILEQQVKDMQDALSAAGKAGLFSSNGKLFVTGYSQGGAVAMATQRALQLTHDSRLMASAPLSGPYAMLKFGDAIMGGKVNRGGTIFTPMLIEGAQRAYGDLYSNINDIYNPPFSTSVPALLPGRSLDTNPLFDQLVQAPLLTAKNDGSESSPPWGVAASGALLTQSARTAYLADAVANPLPADAANPLPARSAFGMRRALLKNDLRSGWVPNRPTLLCGADNDPSVFFDENTTAFKAYVDAKQPSNPVSVLNLNSNISGVNDPYAPLKQSFVGAGLNISFSSALTGKNVHSAMAPYCYLAAYGLFKSLR